MRRIRLSKADVAVAEVKEIILRLNMRPEENTYLWLKMMDLIAQGRCRSMFGYGG